MNENVNYLTMAKRKKLATCSQILRIFIRDHIGPVVLNR